MSILSGIKPEVVWGFFEEICQVPRPSKNEEKIISYLKEFALKYELDFLQDKTGNVIVKKTCYRGYESKQTIVLQSHMDMVCEKNDETNHDFLKDPIIPVIDGDWVKATGTTLGADDGIGMAAQLALLASKDIEHPALECLFTVDEEAGLGGAMGLDDNVLKGRTLINLDSEDDGEIFIGCAGGKDTVATFNYRTRPVPAKSISFKIEVKGLRGGHSGDEIHKGYGNSNKILNRFLSNATLKFGMRLNKFEGGNLRNAIPREAYAIVTIKEKYIVEFETYFSKFCKTIFSEIKSVEPKLVFYMNKQDNPRYVLRMKDQKQLINALYACPNGPMAMSKNLPGLVETSTNLASVKFYEGNLIEIVTSQRSSVESAKDDICAMVASVFKLGGASVKHTDGYPGWNPNTDSPILELAAKSYKKLFGQEPLVRAIHAGLECGLFLEKYPTMDMVSIGPTLRSVHSPDEKIQISTVAKFWEHLLDILKHTS